MQGSGRLCNGCTAAQVCVWVGRLDGLTFAAACKQDLSPTVVSPQCLCSLGWPKLLGQSPGVGVGDPLGAHLPLVRRLLRWDVDVRHCAQRQFQQALGRWMPLLHCALQPLSTVPLHFHAAWAHLTPARWCRGGPHGVFCLSWEYVVYRGDRQCYPESLVGSALSSCRTRCM